VPDEINELLINEPATTKLGARESSEAVAEQLLGNLNKTAPNPRGGEERRLLVGLTDGGRALTFVVERSLDPTTWTVVTGWNSTERERRMLGG
jgi:hypothetical protein